MERKELIEKFLPLARRIARSQGRNFPNLRDELISVAYMALIQAVDKWISKHSPDEPDKYLHVKITYGCLSFIRSDKLVRKPTLVVIKDIKTKPKSLNNPESLSTRVHPSRDVTLQDVMYRETLSFLGEENLRILEVIQEYTKTNRAGEIRTNYVEAAKQLGINRQNLYRRLYEIQDLLGARI